MDVQRRDRIDTVLTGLIATGVTVLVVRLAPEARTGDPLVDVVTQVLLLLALAGVTFVVLRRLPAGASGFLTAWIVGLFLCGGAAVLLNADPFAPIGWALDQGYRTAYLTKFAHTGRLVDYAYRDVPAFYPPLWFWSLGRFAAVVGLPAWKMLKVGTLLAGLLVPVGGWFLWRPLVGPRRAAVVVVVTSLAFQEWYVPHLWVAIAVFVPWWCFFVLGVGRTERLRRGQLAVAVVLGAVVLGTYWYVLIVGVVQLVLALVATPAARRHGLDLGPRSWRDVGTVAAGTAVLTAVYWVPMVVSYLTTPGARTMQNRFYGPSEVSFPLPFLQFSAVGVVSAVGLVSLAVLARRLVLARHLLGLLAGGYALYALGYLGVLAGSPLDTVRAVGVVEFVLAAGAGLGAVALWRTATAAPADPPPRSTTRVLPATDARVLLVVATLVFAVAVGQTAVRDLPFLDAQRDAEYPTETVDGFRAATRGRYTDSVVLTDGTALPTFLPVYVFNTNNAHYANPVADFTGRARFLTRLADETDPTTFALALLHNRFDPVDWVVLSGTGRRHDYVWLADAFPNGSEERKIVFTDEQFGSPTFEPRAAPGQAVYRVDRDQDPLRNLRSCPRFPRETECRTLGRLSRHFGPDLEPATRSLIRRWRAAR